MIGRIILVSAALTVCACTGEDRNSITDSDPVVKETNLIEEAVEALISACLNRGLSKESCECSANASAGILKENDFLEHSELQLRGEPSAIDEFLRRKYAEDSQTMTNLGAALSECPGSVIPVELTP